MSRQQRYLQYCRDKQRTPRGEWIVDYFFRIAYDKRPASELTAITLLGLIPTQFLKDEKLSGKPIDYTFYGNGFLVFKFSVN